VKRITVFLLVLAMSMSVCAQTAQAPVRATATTITAVPVALQSDQGNPDVKVWVNTNSGVYHCSGTRWYGTTKQGVYMTQAEAQKKGYRPAYGKVCR
jgi:hypothetical protein